MSDTETTGESSQDSLTPQDLLFTLMNKHCKDMEQIVVAFINKDGTIGYSYSDGSTLQAIGLTNVLQRALEEYLRAN